MALFRTFYFSLLIEEGDSFSIIPPPHSSPQKFNFILSWSYFGQFICIPYTDAFIQTTASKLYKNENNWSNKKTGFKFNLPYLVSLRMPTLKHSRNESAVLLNKFLCSHSIFLWWHQSLHLLLDFQTKIQFYIKRWEIYREMTYNYYHLNTKPCRWPSKCGDVKFFYTRNYG